MVIQLYCSPDTSDDIHDQLTFISVLNAFLSITAFFDVLILGAFRREFSLHAPSTLLLSNLATTYLCVDLIVQPLYVTLLLTAVNEHWNICRYAAVVFSTSGYVLSGVSLWTLTAKAWTDFSRCC